MSPTEELQKIIKVKIPFWKFKYFRMDDKKTYSLNYYYTEPIKSLFVNWHTS